jgi:Superinfection immunity protein
MRRWRVDIIRKRAEHLYRHHRNRVAISVTNLLLGWTLIGWVVAFIWACTNVES